MAEESKPRRPGLSAYLLDPSYYRLGYQKAAQQLNSSLAVSALQRAADASPERRDGPSPQDAVETATQFLKDVRDVLSRFEQDIRRRRELRWWNRSRPAELDVREQRLERFLRRTVEPCLVLVLAGAQAHLDGDTAMAETYATEVRERATRDQLSYRAYYNLACFEGTRAQQEAASKPKTEPGERITRALNDLRTALRKAPGRRFRTELARWAEEDPALKPLRGNPEFVRILSLYQQPPSSPSVADSDEPLSRPPDGEETSHGPLV